MPSHLLQPNAYACRLAQAIGVCSQVHITITARKGGLVGWWHGLTRGLAWEREWAGVIK